MRRVFVPAIAIMAGFAIFSYLHEPERVPNTYVQSGSYAMEAAQAYLLPIANPGYAPVRDTRVPDPTLDANAALVYHLETDRFLYEKNADTKVPIASLTKLLSVLVVQDLFDQSEIVTVASTAIRVDGVRQTLYVNERIAVKDLVSMMLVESSNDAAYALAAYAKGRGVDFVAQMNTKAYELGMRDCAFRDPAGLDDAAYCTAHDLVRLVRVVLRTAPQLWPLMTQPELTVYSADKIIVHTLKSTNELLGQIPGIIGGKTGNTDGALGCLVLVVKLPNKDDTLVSVVLGSRQRFSDTRTLIDWTRSAFRWQ